MTYWPPDELLVHFAHPGVGAFVIFTTLALSTMTACFCAAWLATYQVRFAGELVGERLLRSEFLARKRSGALPMPPADTSELPAGSPRGSTQVLRESHTVLRGSVAGREQVTDKPLQRPVTPTRSMDKSLRAARTSAIQQTQAGSLTAQAMSMRLGSGMTRYERTQRAAEITAKKLKPADDGAEREYMSAFGSRKELPRTPQRGR